MFGSDKGFSLLQQTIVSTSVAMLLTESFSLHWDLDQNITAFIEENAFLNVVCKTKAILVSSW